MRKNQLFNVTRAALFFCFLLKNLLEKDVKKRKISRRIPPVSFPSPFYDPGLLYKTPHSTTTILSHQASKLSLGIQVSSKAQVQVSSKL